jgi:hypothetical protein
MKNRATRFDFDSAGRYDSKTSLESTGELLLTKVQRDSDGGSLFTFHDGTGTCIHQSIRVILIVSWRICMVHGHFQFANPRKTRNAICRGAKVLCEPTGKNGHHECFYETSSTRPFLRIQ